MKGNNVIYSLVFCSLAYFSIHNGVTTETEVDKFVSMYGNDPNTSGIWTRMRELAADETVLKHICLQVHNILFPEHLLNMKGARVETTTLTFPGTEYKNITADILYCDIRPFPSYSVLTKGLDDDCVFLCWKIGIGIARVFQLMNHTCGVQL